MAGYTREFLVDAFAHRYESLGEMVVIKQTLLAEKLFDEVGKDKFRVYASLDAEAIRKFKLESKPQK
jgi:hypothetical protein